MIKFELVQSDELIVTPTGLAIAGLLINKTNLVKRLNEYRLEKIYYPDIKNSEVVISYLGLLCQGKNDFDNIECRFAI